MNHLSPSDPGVDEGGTRRRGGRETEKERDAPLVNLVLYPPMVSVHSGGLAAVICDGICGYPTFFYLVFGFAELRREGSSYSAAMMRGTLWKSTSSYVGSMEKRYCVLVGTLVLDFESEEDFLSGAPPKAEGEVIGVSVWKGEKTDREKTKTEKGSGERE